MISIVPAALLLSLSGASATSGWPGVKHAYGPYFKDSSSSGDNDNSLWVWKPRKGTTSAAPAAIYFHPGGFYAGEPLTVSNGQIDQWTDQGFVFISVGYRLVQTKYYYTESGEKRLEQFINANADGSLALDESGKTFEDWKVFSGRQSLITKCYYDAVKALEFVIKNQASLNIDVQRLVFPTSSAGTGISNYLTYVYQPLHKGSFHTSALIFTDAQLDYTVENINQDTLRLFANHMEAGEEAPLGDIIDSSSCGSWLGNIACPEVAPKLGIDWQYDLCNATWNDIRMARFCNNNGFSSSNIGDAMLCQPDEEQNWDPAETEQMKNLKLLLLFSMQIPKYPKGADYVYVANDKNGTDANAIPHNPVYSLSYADVLSDDVKYAILYTSFTGMKQDDKTRLIYNDYQSPKGTVTKAWNYKSNFRWRSKYNVASGQDMILFACQAVGITCDMEVTRLYEEESVDFWKPDVLLLPACLATVAGVVLLTAATWRRKRYERLPEVQKELMPAGEA